MDIVTNNLHNRTIDFNSFQNLNSLSYNCTGWSNFKADFIRTLLLTHGIAIGVIQEHFLLSRNLYKLSSVSEHHSVFSIPAFKSNTRIYGGRPSCGLAIFYHKALSQFITHITVPDSHRVQAIELKISGCSYTYINCYFPTDPRVNNFDETELLNVLQDINFVFDRVGPNSKVILLGDINSEFTRNNTFVQTVHNYIHERNLFLLWNLFQCDFTYSQSQVRNNRNHIYYSTLDHFVISENLIDQCIDATPIHLAENLSNHEPIFLKLRIDPVKINGNTNNDQPISVSKPAWNKAKDSDLISYADELTVRLSMIQKPEDALFCSDLHCSNELHKTSMDIYALEITDAISQSVKNNIPYTCAKTKQNIIPGWKEIVQPYKDNAIFWHSIWESLGRPQNNNLHAVMKRTRNKYHHIIRIVKNKEKELRNDRFVNECLHGNVNNIFQEIRLLRKQKSTADTIDGVNGTRNIAEHFKSIYSQLYNTHSDKRELSIIRDRINSNINPDDHVLLNKITPDLISKILRRIKQGKNDVTYDWRSEALKFGCDSISCHLADLFKMYLTHNHMTDAFLKSSLVPIIKDTNAMHSSSENYRAIAISSFIVKLMDYVIYDLQPGAFATSEYQFGFKANTSTTLCSWAVLETVNFFTNRGGVVYACFLDLKKAFDMVKLSILFNKLENKLSPILARFIMHCYLHQRCFVKWNGSESSTFQTTNGVRQGATISPMLFAIYIDELFIKLQNSGFGCFIKHQFMGAFGYADDIVLLSPLKSGLQSMMDMCAEFFNAHGIQISVDENPKKSKTKCMVFNFKEDIPEHLILRNLRVPWTEKYKHLGHFVHQDEDMAHDLNAKRGEFISNIHSLRQEFGQLNPHVFLRLVSTYCTSFYGSNLWDLSGPSSSKLWTTWNVLLKTSFNLPYGTHRYFLNDIATQPHLQVQLFKRFIKFHNSILKSDSYVIKTLYSVQHNDIRSIFGKNRRTMITLCSDDELDYKKISQHITYPIPEDQNWRIPLLHYLLDLRDKNQLILDPGEIDPILNYICCS